MRPPDRVFADEHCEIVIGSGAAIVHDRGRQRYYTTPLDRLPAEVLSNTVPRTSRIGWTGAMTLLLLLGACLVGNYALLAHQPAGSWSATAVCALVAYLAVSVALHEGAHVAALRWTGRRIDRVGVKLNFGVFPAFYVRMNQTLLLSRPEKILVHSAGLLSNLTLNAALLILTRATGTDLLVLPLAVVLTAIAVNAIPMLNSDGYRILLAVTGTDATRTLRTNPWWVVLIKVLSVLYAAASVAVPLATTIRSLLA